MTARQQRALRGVAASSVATLLAAASHTVAGGPAPAFLLVAAMIALLTPVAGALAGPRMSLSRLAAAALVSQAAFHGVFQLLGSPSGTGASAHIERHGHHITLIAASAPAPEGAGMYVAHAVAALVTVALLWRGERLVRAIARGAVALLRRAAAPLPPAAPRLPRPLPAPAVAAVLPALLSSVSRRGPPAALRA